MDIQFLNCTVPDVLTPMKAAKILHIGRSTIYHLLAQGPLCTSQRPEAVSPLLPTDIEHNIKAWNGNSRLLLIFFIFCDILQPTVQSSTQLVQCFSLHIFVGTKPPDRFTVDPALFSQPVCRHSPFLHHDPQFVKYYHGTPPY